MSTHAPTGPTAVPSTRLRVSGSTRQRRRPPSWAATSETVVEELGCGLLVGAGVLSTVVVVDSIEAVGSVSVVVVQAASISAASERPLRFTPTETQVRGLRFMRAWVWGGGGGFRLVGIWGCCRLVVFLVLGVWGGMTRVGHPLIQIGVGRAGVSGARNLIRPCSLR